MIKLYYNPSCSKCVSAQSILDESGYAYEVIHYLENPLSVAELTDLIDMLGISPEWLVRKKDPLFGELFPNNTLLTDTEWIELLSLYPTLLERPIVVKDGKAILGRPPEMILNLL